MMPIKIECDCGQRYAFDVEPVNGRMPSRVACPTCGADGTALANESIARQLFPTGVATGETSAPSPVIRLIELPTAPSQAAAATAPASPVATAAVRAVSPTAGPIAVAVPTRSPTASPTQSTVRLSITANAHPPTDARAPATRRPDPRLGLVDRTQAEHEARAKAMWGDSKEQIVSYLMIQGFTAPEATELATKLFKERTAAVRSNGIRKIIIGIGLMCVPVLALFFFLAIRIFLLKPFAAAVMVGLYGIWLFINGVLMAVAPKSERGDVADQ